MPQGTLNLADLADASVQDKVATLRDLFGFDHQQLSDALGVSVKSVRRWENWGAEAGAAPHSQRGLDALMTMAEALGDLFEPSDIRAWVSKPNPALGGERPIDYVRSPGGILRVADLLGNLGR